MQWIKTHHICFNEFIIIQKNLCLPLEDDREAIIILETGK